MLVSQGAGNPVVDPAPQPPSVPPAANPGYTQAQVDASIAANPEASSGAYGITQTGQVVGQPLPDTPEIIAAYVAANPLDGDVTDDWFFAPYIMDNGSAESVASPILRGNAFVLACERYAKQYDIDVIAAWANAMMEGIHGGIGDSGKSFGPWQMEQGGALPSPYNTYPLYSPTAQAWTWTANGIQYAIRQMWKGGAGGKTGHAAVHAIVYGFEQPANIEQREAERETMYDTLKAKGDTLHAYIAANANGPSVLPTQADPTIPVPIPKKPSQTAWRTFMTEFSTQIPNVANRVVKLSNQYTNLVR